MTLEELHAKIAALEGDLATVTANTALAVNAASEKSTNEERTRCLNLVASAATFKISSDLLTKRLAAGPSKEDALDIFEAIAESSGTASHIETSGSSLDSTAKTEADISSKSKTALDSIMLSSGVSLQQVLDAEIK